MLTLACGQKEVPTALNRTLQARAYFPRSPMFISITRDSRAVDSHMVLVRSYPRSTHVVFRMTLGGIRYVPIAKSPMMVSRNAGSNELPSSCIFMILGLTEHQPAAATS